MFLHHMKEDSMILDFQLIYDTDCKLHFDFYAYGLAKEPEILGIDAKCNVISYGMVQVNSKDYKKINNRIEEFGDNNRKLENLLIEIRGAIRKLIEANYKIEQQMKENEYNNKSLEDIFIAMINVMAYRRIADYGGERLAEKVEMKRHLGLGVPSYLSILNDNKKRITSKKDVQTFIEEYAYLSTFDIGTYDYEDINQYTFDNSTEISLTPINIPYDDSRCESLEEKLLYGYSWFSELRHIYQSRTLRNFRWFLHAIDMDIFETSAKELFYA